MGILWRILYVSTINMWTVKISVLLTWFTWFIGSMGQTLVWFPLGTVIYHAGDRLGSFKKHWSWHKVWIFNFSNPALKMFSVRESFKSVGMEFESVTILFGKIFFLYLSWISTLWGCYCMLCYGSTLSIPLIILKVWTRSRRFLLFSNVLIPSSASFSS